MMRSVFKIPQKIAGQMAVDILSRNMSGQPRQRMEDYFKDKKFIVTGSCAGKRNQFLLKVHWRIVSKSV